MTVPDSKGICITKPRFREWAVGYYVVILQILTRDPALAGEPVRRLALHRP